MTSQVPLWVTITLGLLAIAGPIAGAWTGGTIVARRDDRRWIEERNKEEARWRREYNRDEERYWRERRTSSFVEFIDHGHSYNNIAGQLVAELRVKPTFSEAKKLLEIADERARALQAAAARVELDASREIQVLSLQQAAEASEFRADAYRIAIKIFDKETAGKYDANTEIEALDRKLDEIIQLSNKFINQARKELGTPDYAPDRQL